MIERRPAPDRLPNVRLFHLIAIVSAILLVGFLLLQSPPSVALFRAVADLLSLCAAAILRAGGFPIVRTGIELRDSVTGHAIVVTQACDGSSLLIAAAAVAVWLWRGNGRHDYLWLIASTLVAVFLFNLIRVVLLFVTIPTPEIMEAQHLYVAPLLGAVLVAGVIMAGLRLPVRETVRAPLLWATVAIVATILWYPAATTITCSTVVPLANTLLWLIPGDLERAIVCQAQGAIVATSGVVAYEPIRILDFQFHPAEFTLAVPLVAASLALVRQPAAMVRGAGIALVLFSVAMTLGAMTASQDAAAGAAVSALMGQSFSAPFAPMDETWLALLKSAQNAMVHFNLFVLPLALLYSRSAATPDRAVRSPRVAGSRGRGRRP